MLPQCKVVVHESEEIVEGEAILIGDHEWLLARTLLTRKVLVKAKAELLREHPEGSELRGLHDKPACVLGDKDCCLGARHILHGKQARHLLAEGGRHMGLRQEAREERLKRRRLPVALQLDLEGRILDGLDKLRHESKRQPELGDTRPRLVVRRKVGGGREDVQIGAQHRRPHAEDDRHHLRAIARSNIIQVDGGLREHKATRRLERHCDVLHWLQASQRDVEVHSALHHGAINPAHWIVGVSVVLLAPVQRFWDLGLNGELFLRLSLTLAVRLPDDPQQLLMLLFHLVVIELLHLGVHKARRGWIRAHVAHLYLAPAVHAYHHAAHIADGVHASVHRDQTLQPGAPNKLHLPQDHDVALVSAEEQVEEGRSIWRLRRQLVAQRRADGVLGNTLLQLDATIFLDCENGVLANDEDLLLVRCQRPAEAGHFDVLCVLTDVRRPIHLDLLPRLALGTLILVHVISCGRKHLVAICLDEHGVAADDKEVELGHVA
mmetsp:Transcript_47987/g.121865  ORF Transcript_47987/g.121865 Transcript_47987/m.121865 type:complete len:492 (-) Transcript_47987:563-2038(-)